MRLIFRGAGWLTLLVDAYLLLALVATRTMNTEYHHMLPPFGWDVTASIPRLLYLVFALWTAFLAIGCLYATTLRHGPIHDGA